jgi:diguanylate cyclase (GGDEF)-like protein/PAS domain S-box-containing protein
MAFGGGIYMTDVITSEFYDRIGNSFLTGIYIIQDRVIRMVNKHILDYSGYSIEELIGSPIMNFIHLEDRPQVEEASARMLSGQTKVPYEYRIIDKRGNVRWLAESVVSITYEGKPAILGNMMEITETKEKEEIITKMAYFDSLTKLPNRRLFSDRLEAALSFASRYQHKLAVIMMDLDKFKDVNDTLGQQVGDELLQAVARRLEVLFRKEDTFAHISGDKFVVLLPRLDQVNHIFRIAKRIMDTLQLPFIIQGHALRIYASAGVAIFPNHGQDAESLIRNSDIAMYKAKDAGRNQYCLFDTR